MDPIPTSNLTGASPDLWEISPEMAAIIGVEAAILFVNLLVLAYVIVNREYPPLKIKQIHIVSGNYVSGLIWWIGGCASMRLFPQVNSRAFLYCDLWTIWIQLVLGIYIWICLVLIRFWRLYAIINIRNRFYRTPKGIAAAFMVLWTPTLIYGIFSSAFMVDGPIYVDQIWICSFMSEALYSNFGILVVYFGLLLFFLITLRNMKQKYLKEYRETAISFGICAVCYIVYLVVISVGYHDTTPGKAICSMIIIIIQSSVFYLTIGKPAFKCMFDRENYEKEFMSTVKNFSTGTDTKTNNATTTATDMKSKGSQSQLELEEVQTN